MSKFSRLINYFFFVSPVVYAGFVVWIFYYPSSNELKAQKHLKTFNAKEFVAPLEKIKDLDPLKIALGERLFHDPLLSINKKIRCTTCHDLKKGGVDGNDFSIGVSGKPLSLNTPSVLNSAYNISSFWDGRAQSIEEAIRLELTHIDKMGMTLNEVVTRLMHDSTYKRSFYLIYDDKIKPEYVFNALSTYQKSLITINSRFDEYLKGNHSILTSQELKGYELFKSYGCISCHQGKNFGGNLYQKIGTIKDYYYGEDKNKRHNLGRYNVTQQDRDRNVFKVPSLRNVALTPPYYHDSSAPDLESAISQMAYFQLGLSLSQKDTQDIAAFLKTLNGYIK